MRAIAAGPFWVSLLCSAMACNEGLQPVPMAHEHPCPAAFQGVCGTVTFRGALPESTQAVFIVAFATFPSSPNDLFTFVPRIPPELFLDAPSRATSQQYTLPIPDTTYHWILAVWQKKGVLSPQNADTLLQEAGYYRDPADTTKPGVVVVAGRTTGVDFVVDFTNRHPVSYYFP